LHVATAGAHVPVMELLQRMGAAINAKDAVGEKRSVP
jgi:hypothetical protein